MTAEPIYAALDLGSNSFHLLLAAFRDGKLTFLDRRKSAVRLASGLGEDGSLDLASRQRALEALGGFSRLIENLPKSHVRVVGTNTLRAAREQGDFIEQAEAVLGHRIDIISGIEEARLIYQGVAGDLAPGEGMRLVLDIGGGSTEVILGDDHPRLLESLYMGCVSWTLRFFPDGKLSAGAYQSAVLVARGELLALTGQLDHYDWDEAIGASGTVRAVGSLLQTRGHEYITLDGIHAVTDELLAFGHLDAINIKGVSAERAAVLPGGLAILEALFVGLGINEVQVSEYAVREGIIHELAGRFHSRDRRQQTLEYLMNTYQVDVGHAQRLGALAVEMFHQLGAGNEDEVRFLRWACNLHEIGLGISHAGYHKHSAYIIANADMPGFSQREQRKLAFLVHNHRRKIKRDHSPGAKPCWELLYCMRLAYLFCRSRVDVSPAGLAVSANDSGDFGLALPALWIEDHPLTHGDLQAEVEYWQKHGFRLTLHCA